MPDVADLATLRQRLTKMTDRILMRLHDRAGFPLNAPVYRRGAIPVGERNVSLMEFALEGLEAYHASLGRFEYPDQHPLTSTPLPASTARRVVDAGIPRATIELRETLLAFYVEDILPRLCAPGDDATAYGETAYVDADLLALLHERINVGRQVAFAKASSDPAVRDAVADEAALTERLRDRAREQELLADVRDRARRYELDPDLAAYVFAWIIEQTIRVEVAYLQNLEPGPRT
jgi:chorismate mutase